MIHDLPWRIDHSIMIAAQFYWAVPIRHCWWQLLHSDYGEQAIVLLVMLLYTISLRNIHSSKSLDKRHFLNDIINFVKVCCSKLPVFEIYVSMTTFSVANECSKYCAYCLGSRSKTDEQKLHSLEAEVLELRTALKEAKHRNLLLEEQLEQAQ